MVPLNTSQQVQGSLPLYEIGYLTVNTVVESIDARRSSCESIETVGSVHTLLNRSPIHRTLGVGPPTAAKNSEEGAVRFVRRLRRSRITATASKQRNATEPTTAPAMSPDVSVGVNPSAPAESVAVGESVSDDVSGIEEGIMMMSDPTEAYSISPAPTPIVREGSALGVEREAVVEEPDDSSPVGLEDVEEGSVVAVSDEEDAVGGESCVRVLLSSVISGGGAVGGSVDEASGGEGGGDGGSGEAGGEGEGEGGGGGDEDEGWGGGGAGAGAGRGEGLGGAGGSSSRPVSPSLSGDGGGGERSGPGFGAGAGPSGLFTGGRGADSPCGPLSSSSPWADCPMRLEILSEILSQIPSGSKGTNLHRSLSCLSFLLLPKICRFQKPVPVFGSNCSRSPELVTDRRSQVKTGGMVPA